MRQITINGQKRESIGKADAKAQRKAGMVPCVIYGGEQNINFIADEREFTKLLFTPEVFNVVVNLDGTEYSTILQAKQFHPVSDKLIHADFLEVNPEKELTLEMAVMLKGSPIGVRNGGKLRQPLRKLKVRGLLSNLPDGGIELDIENLRIGQAIKVANIESEGLTFLNPASAVVVAVKMARGAVADDEEGAEESGAEEGASEAAAE
jgi:large subunit ribosomal protein L25